ncbi:MAG TPA: imelysin family protein [Labilithrix sp.]|nr:imelysin family protein [Labilithrix sp.]
MKPRRVAPLLLWLACVATPSAGCIEEVIVEPSAPEARAKDDKAFAEAARATVRGYGKVGRATHDEAVRLCKLMEKAIEDFIKAPSPELLANAKVAWRTARDAYSRAEAFRFTGSPLDEDIALATQVEIAPVDVTLLEGPTLEAGGILDDLMHVPDVTGDAVRDAARGKNVQLGWHAIEGMLYGAAVTSGGPPRPHTDFVNDGPAHRNARRGRLVAKLARILIEDLEIVANQWDPDRTDSFAQKLVRGPLDEGFRRALRGVARFAREEMVGRKLGGVLAGAPEISDASDSTRADLASNALGIEGLLFAREGRVTEASFIDLVRRDDPALADALVSAIAASRASIEACPATLAEVGSDPQKRSTAERSRDAQLAIAARIDDVIRHYGLTP